LYAKSKTVRSSTRIELNPNEEEKMQSMAILHDEMENHIQYMYPEMSGEFAWDPEASSKEISFSNDFRHAFLYETNYYFRTITSNRPFFSGVHYWEIIADARTEHELKIGVTA
jgi:hypothetical protein